MRFGGSIDTTIYFQFCEVTAMAEFCTHERHGGICEKTDTYCNLGACPYEDLREFVPVRHGRWKCNKPCPVCGGDRFEGLDADIWADCEPPYCPNCGAKMDGGIDNG